MFQHEVPAGSFLDSYRALLTGDERLKESRFRFERHQHQYLITRALIRTVLSGYSDVDPSDWRFTADAYGRPHVIAPNIPGTPSFNLAHTDGLIVCASMSSGAVGVDVEHTRSGEAPLEIAHRYFSAGEYAELQAWPLAARGKRFFDYWTLKESYIKAAGKGLSIPLAQFTFRLARRGHIELTFHSGLADDPQRWRCWLLEPVPTHVVAVCAERTAPIAPRIVARKVIPLLSEEPLECAVLAQSQD